MEGFLFGYVGDKIHYLIGQQLSHKSTAMQKMGKHKLRSNLFKKTESLLNA